MRWWAIAALAATALVAGTSAAEDELSITPRKFDHEAHVSRGVDIAEACNTCHPAELSGEIVPVGKNGHAPCMASGCHVSDFLAIGNKEGERYRRAMAFCLGCHDQPPMRHKKATAGAAFAGNDNPDYHVELDHAEHIGRARCTECHAVDERTFEALYTPGHDQCAKCHGESGDVPRMGLCSGCHQTPGRHEFFDAAARKELDLKSCDSVWREDMTDEEREQTPCFRHERKEHRFKGGKQLQCDSCHYMVSKQASKYATIEQIKSQPIIDGTSMDRYCGVRGCHPDVDSTSKGMCERCHHKNIRKKLLQGFVH